MNLNIGNIAAGGICAAVLSAFVLTTGGSPSEFAADASHVDTDVVLELSAKPLIAFANQIDDPLNRPTETAIGGFGRGFVPRNVTAVTVADDAAEMPVAEISPAVEPAEIPNTPATPSVSEETVVAALMVSYGFDEQSDRVRTLQGFLGVTRDGHYGAQTRSAHIGALTERGLDTSHVPVPALSNTIPVSAECGDMAGVTKKYVVGDSLSVGVEMVNFVEDASAACLNLVQYSARSGRMTYEAEAIAASWGPLGSDAVVLIALGTNDIWGSQESFLDAARGVLNEIGSQAQVIWLDVSEDIPNANEAKINDAVVQLAGEYSNVVIADWSAYEQANNVRRAGDGVHYNMSQYVKRANFYYELLAAFN